MPISTILVDPYGPLSGQSAIYNVIRYVGEPNVPQDVKRRRRQISDAMRRFGTPVLVKHMYNADDVDAGIAEPSPGFSPVYGQSRNTDPLSHGIGFVSIEKSDNEWYNTSSGELQVASDSPGAGWLKAPRYRGFGPGYLTYIIEPDAAEDVFKLNEAGALIKVQTATAQAPWYPEISDNDLIINVILEGMEIQDTLERFQAKVTNPISLRGYDRKGRREYSEDGGNRHIVNQQFEMTLVPSNNVLMSVETDR